MNRLVLLLLLFVGNRLFSTGWDVEYWQYLNIENGRWGSCRLYTVGEARLYHWLTRPNYYRITEAFAYQARPWLGLEAHYSFLYLKSRGTPKFHKVNRLEFEVNPSFGIFRWRNRLDVVKREGVSSIRLVLRSRLIASLPTTWGSYDVFDEVFYDFEHGKWTQNRFVPIQLNIKGCVDTSLFLAVRSRYSFGANKWFNSFVLGCQFNF